MGFVRNLVFRPIKYSAIFLVGYCCGRGCDIVDQQEQHSSKNSQEYNWHQEKMQDLEKKNYRSVQNEE